MDDTVKFVRPLDRSQDKCFELLSHGDQSKLTDLRHALEKAKIRSVTLKDETEHKDDIIKEERHLRCAAEERLKKVLVDVYENPEVNSELRHRLPYANKTDPFPEARQQNLYTVEAFDEDNIKQLPHSQVLQMNVETLNLQQAVVPSSQDSQDTAPTQNQILSHTRPSFSLPDKGMLPGSYSQHCGDATTSNSINAGQHTEHLDCHVGSTPRVSSLLTSQNMSRSSKKMTSKDNIVDASQNVGAAYLNDQYYKPLTISTHGPGVVESQGPLSTSSAFSGVSFAKLPQPRVEYMQTSPLIHDSRNPLASASFSSLPVSSYVALPRVYENDRVEHSVTAQQGDHRNEEESTFATRNSESMYELRRPIPPVQSGHLQHGAAPQSIHTYPYQPYSPLFSSSATMPHSNNVSHISRLLAEISTLKKEKEELKDNLKNVEKRCEELRLGIKETADKENEIDIGAIIEEIRSAEKTCTESAKMRVEVAEEDKEKALKELNNQKLSQMLNKQKTISDSELSDMEDDGIVDTSRSSSSLSTSKEQKETTFGSRNGSASDLQHSSYTKKDLIEMNQRQRIIMAEELQKVIDERNDARQMVMHLQKKISSLELMPQRNDKEDELVATLSVVQHERDVAVSRLKAMRDEMNEIKFAYSLFTALKRDDDPQNDINTSNLSTKNTWKNDEVKTKLEEQLTCANFEKENQNQRIIELESLVKRQRQKLNALCAGPMLME